MAEEFIFGLALSGGGHKGIAHAGLLKFLIEQNIKPTIISGTSAGAIVGALYAKGRSPEYILDLFKSVSFFNWNIFTTKKAGLFDIDRLEVYLDKEFGDQTIGELDIELFISATDMERGKLKIFRKETLIKRAILASCAFPGIFSPVTIDNKIYSDGGLVNNFPVTTIRGRCDYLIGSNVNSVVNQSSSKLKSIKSITIRSFEIMMMHSAQMYKHLADWYIEPEELSNYFTFETSKKRMEEIFEAGYQEAKSSFKGIDLKI